MVSEMTARKLAVVAQTEDELAGVLGHEIGHLLARQQTATMECSAITCVAF